MSRFITSLSKIKANSLNLAGTFGFSGTVSGLADETPLVLITETTASSSASVSFTSGIDSTYDEYLIVITNMHPSTGGSNGFVFQGSTDGGSNYNTTITSTHIISEHAEDGSADNVYYWANGDLAQGTGYQRLTPGVGNGNDEQYSGILKLYSPSSTTFVKHFLSFGNAYTGGGIYSDKVAGYFNTTSAINAIDFKMESGTIDSGTFQLFGVV